MPRYDIVTFDCYGTLIDWESGIVTAFETAARAAGVLLDGQQIMRAYAALEPLVEVEGYRPYRDVLTETARRVANMLGWPITPSQASFLADSLPAWKPFPDTNSALARIAASGCRLGILSNVDDDLLTATQRHLTARFDLVITAQLVQSYKPMLAHFLTARENVGNQRWLHAAGSNVHDIVPTNALGIPNAWINRGGYEPLPGGIPLREFRNLDDLADWVTA